MYVFFRDWRRKAGCVTLVVACALMGGWIRSTYFKDVIVPPRWMASHVSILSLEKSIVFNQLSSAPASAEPLWTTFAIDGSELNTSPHWVWRSFTGFGYISTPWGQWCLVVPYWALVTPLALASAYLLLWTPRKQTRYAAVSSSPHE